MSASDSIFDLANTSIKHVSHYRGVFVIASTFSEFTFIVEYCPLTSTLGARSLHSISHNQKKDFAGFPNIRVSEKMRSNHFYSLIDVNNAPK